MKLTIAALTVGGVLGVIAGLRERRARKKPKN